MKPMTCWGSVKTKRFQQSASTRRAQLSVAVTTVRLNVSFYLLYQDLSQCWLDKIRKAFSCKNHPSWCSVSFRQYCPCVESMRLPRLVRRKVAMLRAFNVGFRKFIRVVFYCWWLCTVELTLFCTVWRFFLWLPLMGPHIYLIQKYFDSILSLTS